MDCEAGFKRADDASSSDDTDLEDEDLDLSGYSVPPPERASKVKGSSTLGDGMLHFFSSGALKWSSKKRDQRELL
eukprot:3507734-Prymnesium_polylepis.1